MFFESNNGRIYVKAQTVEVLKEALGNLGIYERECITDHSGLIYKEIEKINTNEYWVDNISCGWRALQEIIKKLIIRKDILVIADYLYYDKKVYGDRLVVYLFCGGKEFSCTYDSDQTAFGVYKNVKINDPKAWIDYIDFRLSRESTVILSNFGITGLKRGVEPIKFLEMQDEFSDLIVMMCPAFLNFIGIMNTKSFIGCVLICLGIYVTFHFRKKMKYKFMFALNVFISVLGMIMCIFFFINKMIFWIY